MVALQNLLDPTIEPLNHAVGLRRLGRLGRGQAVLNSEFGAELIELMLPALCALAQAKEAVGELLAVARQNGADAQWAGLLQITQEATRIGGGLVVANANEHPAGRRGRLQRTGSDARTPRPSEADTSCRYECIQARKP